MNVLRILRHPRAAVVAHDLSMVIVSWLLAGWIFYRGANPDVFLSSTFLAELFIVLAVQGLVLWATGLYKGLWRFASFPDLWNIARATMFGTLLIIAAYTVLHSAQISRFIGSVLIYSCILFLA